MPTQADPTAKPLTFNPAPDWLRLSEARLLAGNLSLRTLRRWIAIGHVRIIKPTGGTVLVSRDSLRAFLESAPSAEYQGRHYEGLDAMRRVASAPQAGAGCDS